MPWIVLARSNTGIVGPNPIRGMDDVCVSVLVLSCVGSDLAKGSPHVQKFYQLSVKFIVSRLILNWEQARRSNPSNYDEECADVMALRWRHSQLLPLRPANVPPPRITSLQGKNAIFPSSLIKSHSSATWCLKQRFPEPRTDWVQHDFYPSISQLH